MDNLKIPKKNKLAVVGLRGPFECLNKARYGISWGVIGAMENIINTTIDYSEERNQFSKSLITFQLIQSDLIKSIELYNNSLNNSFASYPEWSQHNAKGLSPKRLTTFFL